VGILKPSSPDVGKASTRNSRKVVSSAFVYTAGGFQDVLPAATDETPIIPQECRDCEEPLLNLSDI
jgi:hypothetical protein